MFRSRAVRRTLKHDVNHVYINALYYTPVVAIWLIIEIWTVAEYVPAAK